MKNEKNHNLLKVLVIACLFNLIFISFFPYRSFGFEKIVVTYGGGYYLLMPVVYGNYVAYFGEDNCIYLFEIPSRATWRIRESSGGKSNLGIYGDYVVWAESGEYGSGGIYMYTISTAETKLVTNYGSRPSIFGNKIVWMGALEDTYYSRYGIIIYDINSGKKEAIKEGMGSNDLWPVINGSQIVWYKDYNVATATIALYNMATGKSQDLARMNSAMSLQRIGFYGDIVAFCDEKRVRIYNISTGEDRFIDSYVGEFFPSVYGKYIVWTDTRRAKDPNDPGDIMYYNYETGEKGLITDINVDDERRYQEYGYIYSGKVVFVDHLSYYQDQGWGVSLVDLNYLLNDSNLIIEDTGNPYRLYGRSRYETAAEISKKGWEHSETVILARGDNFPDALSGASLAGKYSCPILLTNQGILTDVTKEEIARLVAKEVFILGSEDAIYPEVINQLEEKLSIPNSKIHRLGGKDRYETSGIISSQLEPPQERIAIVATGENYPDALSSAPIAFFKKIPILLVGEGSISSEVQNTLKKFRINKVIIVGGEDVVEKGYEDWFVKNNYQTERIFGDDRYYTAKAMAEYGLSQGMGKENVYLATGENFPDALSLGPLSGKNKGVLLLSSKDFLRKATREFLTSYKDEIKESFIAGGRDVFSYYTREEIKGILGL